MSKKVLFGAGGEAAFALSSIRQNGDEVSYIVDNDKTRRGMKWLGIEIIGFDDYLALPDRPELIVSVELENHRKEIVEQIKNSGINNWRVFHKSEWKGAGRERIISYAQTTTLEDVILYHVCHEMDEIFYIDVGAADPYELSVTKTLYDSRNAHGINIEPQKNLFLKLKNERPRDININAGVGNERGKLVFYRSEQTFAQRYGSDVAGTDTVDVYTLTEICEEHLSPEQVITFLKIDVEGFERSVLEGMDFNRYRPQIIVMEATKPHTRIWCYDEWEDVLLSNHYHLAYEYGIDRWYVADEHKELDRRFVPMEEMLSAYVVRKASFDCD